MLVRPEERNRLVRNTFIATIPISLIQDDCPWADTLQIQELVAGWRKYANQNRSREV
ncbi:hypothetical protein BCIN_01g06680 [Botrytis cinerea B05.10]|uniref:Uncharacterized protein n=1 Tax=Botryotinia fuckeliana (strain B05.10) TaxID=332648 RepID=A0A384J623_BOTFB|nr:hypothetical protein BCIN_01g06680 [Botrytis cinerea B05.10]ATZ45983.1 hypothetical protein BCIN_01g06680 [Botrytis cinerea B05.10]